MSNLTKSGSSGVCGHGGRTILGRRLGGTLVVVVAGEGGGGQEGESRGDEGFKCLHSVRLELPKKKFGGATPRKPRMSRNPKFSTPGCQRVQELGILRRIS